MVKGIKGIFRAYFEDFFIVALEKFDYTPTLLDFDYTPNQIASIQFAPITIAAIARTFSRYKTLFAQNRRSFSFENLKLNLIINCFYNKVLKNLLS